MLVEQKHHDIYPKIDPTDPISGLANSAKGRTVIVTGAGPGIGRSIAIRQAQAGAKVVIVAARTQADIAETAKQVTDAVATCKVLPVRCDVTDKESVKNMIDTAVEASEADTAYTLFNNAGYMEETVPLAESDPDTWKKTWDVNIMAVYLPTRLLLDHLKLGSAGKHYIINTSSIGSYNTRPRLSAYQPSKTAVNRITDFIAQESSDSYNLVAFAIHPGGVKTALVHKMPKEVHSVLIDTPELVAGFAVWLTSGAIDWANGRYLECNWDIDDIISKKKDVEEGKWWKTTVLI